VSASLAVVGRPLKSPTRRRDEAFLFSNCFKDLGARDPRPCRHILNWISDRGWGVEDGAPPSSKPAFSRSACKCFDISASMFRGTPHYVWKCCAVICDGISFRCRPEMAGNGRKLVGGRVLLSPLVYHRTYSLPNCATRWRVAIPILNIALNKPFQVSLRSPPFHTVL
jgi:hypothetical protein